MERLRDCEILSLDTETYGLSESDLLFSIPISAGTPELSFYFNFKDYPEEGIIGMPKADIAGLRELFEDPNRLWYMQNAKFDLHMLAKEGYRIAGRIFDDEAIGRVVKNNHPAYNLKIAAGRIGLKKLDIVEEYIKKHKLITKVQVPGKKKIFERKHFDKVPLSIIGPYGEADALVTFQLGVHLKKELEKTPDLLAVARNESELTKTCFEIERGGLLIDPVYTRAAWQYQEKIVKDKKVAFVNQYGRPYPEGDNDLKEFFISQGVTLPKTATGRDSLTKKVLENSNHPAAESVVAIRESEKLISTYYSSFLHYRDHRNLVRPNMRQAGTETGRFSYSEPNFQNLPKEDEEEDLLKPYQVRGCIIPPPGEMFVAIDYAQQEYRMMLDYAGEMKLIKLVMDGADLHQATADMVGVSRKQAKTLNFAILYGAGAEKVGQMLKITTLEAQYLIDKYYSRLPAVQRFVYKVKSKGRERGYITNWLGRRCYVARPEWAYILPNHLIQGGCADVVKVAMNQIFGQKLPPVMKLQVHDELLFQLKPEHQDAFAKIVPIMENVYPSFNGMKLLVDVSHSFKSYSAKDKLKGLAA